MRDYLWDVAFSGYVICFEFKPQIALKALDDVPLNNSILFKRVINDTQFFVIDNELYTAPLKGTVLRGVTRDQFISRD